MLYAPNGFLTLEPLYSQGGELPVLPLSISGAVSMSHVLDNDSYLSGVSGTWAFSPHAACAWLLPFMPQLHAEALLALEDTCLDGCISCWSCASAGGILPLQV